MHTLWEGVECVVQDVECVVQDARTDGAHVWKEVANAGERERVWRICRRISSTHVPMLWTWCMYPCDARAGVYTCVLVCVHVQGVPHLASVDAAIFQLVCKIPIVWKPVLDDLKLATDPGVCMLVCNGLCTWWSLIVAVLWFCCS